MTPPINARLRIKREKNELLATYLGPQHEPGAHPSCVQHAIRVDSDPEVNGWRAGDVFYVEAEWFKVRAESWPKSGGLRVKEQAP